MSHHHAEEYQQSGPDEADRDKQVAQISLAAGYKVGHYGGGDNCKYQRHQ